MAKYRLGMAWHGSCSGYWAKLVDNLSVQASNNSELAGTGRNSDLKLGASPKISVEKTLDPVSEKDCICIVKHVACGGRGAKPRMFQHQKSRLDQLPLVYH